MNALQIPDCDEFLRGVDEYERNEQRGYVYFQALNHIQQNWGNPEEMAQGIGLLLQSWHQGFYRFGNYDRNLLIECIERNLEIINKFRDRDISSLSNNDETEIKELFNQFLDALRGGNRKSPVAVAKSLNLLTPKFLPLWDSDIALAYGYVWGGILTEFTDTDYISFCWKMKEMAEKIQGCLPNPDDRSFLKRIDEYNYSKYTKGWI
ncbi:MAG: hypothetical protein HY753_03845 [Nitrospirae bacterium]|nr:hypothetical protein [Nitrospirota bacterium]